MKHYNAHGVIHRDIKPENIMIGQDGCPRFCDFGVAKKVKSENNLRTDVGTDRYKAPEVFLRQYDEKCDIWALGVVLYQMVIGDTAFDNDEGLGSMIKNIKQGNYKPIPDSVSDELKDLLSNMIKVDIKDRFSASQCLEHPWFTQEQSPLPDCEVSDNCIQRLRKFRHGSKLRIAILNILVKTIHATNYLDLQTQFKVIDTDGSGVITRDELEEVIKNRAELKVEQEEIDNILNEIDYDGNGSINYSEFLAATLPIENYVTQEQLQALFQQFTGAGDKEITAENLKDGFIKFGWSGTTEEEIEQIMNQHDLDKNLLISYKEFCEIIRDKDLGQ